MAERLPLDNQSNATLLVGDAACTYIEICEILMTSAGGVPASKLLEISRRLGLPNDFISMINPWLLTGIKTNHSILYEMIEAWRGKESTNATLSTILKVLKDSELYGCSDALKTYFNVEENEIPKAEIYKDSVMPISEALSGLPQDFIEKYLSYGKTTEPLVSNSVPKALKFYIPRRIAKRSHLDASLFTYYCKDVFVVKNIQLHELSLLAGSHSTDLSSNQIFGLTVRFILLEHEDDFEEICKLSTGDPIHLIDYNDCKLIWVKTHGNKLSSLHKFIHGEQEQLIEKDFIESCLSSRQPICISDTPGMGKTLLLSSIAHHIMKKYPSRLVQFIVLREFVQKIEHEKLNDVNFCINLLAGHLTNSDLGKEIVMQLLNSQLEIVELMFDGFDEVLSNQVETAKLVLRQFSSIKSVRLYVATRPHMREELENTLGVLGFNIQGFERQEQIGFLTKYWEYQCGAVNNGRLNEFAKACLESLTENINDFEQEFAGIPLQCFLIAEVYKSQALRHSSEGKWLTNFGKGIAIRITSIFEMYQQLVELRFEKIGQNKKLYTKAHIYLAVQLLFPEHSHIFEEEKMESQQLYSFGILEKKNTNSETPRFVHRSFAEYFVGMFIAQTLVAEDPKYNFFLNVALQTEQSRHHFFISSKIGKCKPIENANFRYPVLCYFVDAQVKLFQNEIIKGVTWAYERKMLYGMLAACITHNYANLYQQLLKPDIHKWEIEQEQHLVNLLYLSAKTGNIELFSLVHQHNMKVTKKPSLIFSSSPKFHITPLHIAVELGHYRIVEYLLKFQNPTKLRYIYHCCVGGSGADSEDTISYKIEILKLLPKLGRELINEPLPDGTTPLLCFNVHVKLRQSLVDLGADVNEVINSKTLLHVVAENKINAETYHDFLMSLLAQGFKGINSPDSRKQTPLHVALQHIELLENTFNIFCKSQANFNAVDKYEDSLLFHAVRHGRSVSIIKILESNGADIKHKNVKRENVLHIAAKYGNIPALEHFLMSPKILMTEVTASNDWWSIDTPFMQAMKMGNCLPVCTIQLMESKGLVIGTEVASKALTYVLRNKKLVTNGLEKVFVEATDYLLKRGGRYESNAWKLEPTKRILGRVKQITQCNSSLLGELRKRDVISDDEMISLLGKTDELYQKLETLERENSFEKLIVSLIACNQITPFRLLKQCLQMYLPGSATFSTPHSDFLQFIEYGQENLLGLCSWDLELTIQRLKDTIDPDILFANEKNLADELQDEKLVIFQPETAVPPKDAVELLKTNKTKAVILSSSVDEFAEYKILRDDFSWSDLSSERQKKIESEFLVKIGNTLIKFAKASFQFSSLKNGFLAAIIRYQVAEFRGFEGKRNENQYISNSIFNFFLPDKLLFQGITQTDLQKFSKFGHRIGGLGGQLENLNYIIVESEDQFKEVCSKSTESVHLIQFVKNEARFKLLETRGSTTKIQIFIENQNCREFPACNCNHASSDLKICFSFTDSKSKMEQLVSVGPNEVPRQLLNLTGFQDSLELSEIKKSFTEWFHSNKDVLNSSTVLQPDSDFPNLETKTNRKFEIVHKWLQLLNCTTTEMAKLKQLAVTTLFPNLIQNSNSNGMHKFFEMGLLKRKFGNFVLVHDALAWCVIAEMVLSTETASFVTLSELRDIIFTDCFEQCAVFIPYNMSPDEIYYSEKISFFTFKNSRIFDFIELYLSKRNIANELTNYLTVHSTEEIVIQKWVYSCVVGNCFNLLKIIASLNVHHNLFASQELLILAIKYASVPIIQFVVDEFAKQTGCSVPNIRLNFERKSQFSNYTFTETLSILHIAALRGEKSSMDFLINNYNLAAFLSHADNLDLLNFCVVDTYHMLKLQIEERKCIINNIIIIHKNLQLMEEKRQYRPSALLVPKIHIELILHLINLGIDVHDSYQLSENILHKCPNYLNAQEYDMLVQLLHAKGKSSIFHTTDGFQRTPLHRAVEKLELVESTFQVFASSKADFNSIDRHGNTVLMCAVQNFRSAGLFESLIRHGADVFRRDNISRNIIHLAARYGDQTAVRYFLSLGFNVNATDDYNYTPLHEALNFPINHTHEKVNALVEHGADINAANGLLETPLSLAIEGNELGRVQYRTVKFLKSAGGQVIEPNEFAVTNFLSTFGDYD